MKIGEYPVFANRPQIRSLGLLQAKSTARTWIQPVEAGFKGVATLSFSTSILALLQQRIANQHQYLSNLLKIFRLYSNKNVVKLY